MESISITYHDETGRISGGLTASPDTIEPNKIGLWVYGVGDPDVDYVKDGQIIKRPFMTATRENNVLMGLPVPCVINIDGTDYECTENTVELDFDLPGSYPITVKAWPYHDKEFNYAHIT